MINVTTGEFYGPFDLLLELIEKSKMDIYDINISEITNSYIEKINTIDIPSDELTDFILIAATLLAIKTRSLVKDSIEVQEENDDEISKDELIRRLVEYKKIKKVIIYLREFEKRGMSKYAKVQEDLLPYASDVEDNIVFDVEVLKMTLESLILKSSLQDEFKVERILNIEEYSLEEYNEKIKIDIFKKKVISISSMLKMVESKSEAIIIFLSILELSKQNQLTIRQDHDTKEIVIEAVGSEISYE
ncbi:MAG: segregation/condensation protein A [Tissierellia bacterium]|nr:segregation/condensation protein A [Tissierellia bacterium]